MNCTSEHEARRFCRFVFFNLIACIIAYLLLISNELTNTYYPPVTPVAAVSDKAGTRITWLTLKGITAYRIYRAVNNGAYDFQVVAKYNAKNNNIAGTGYIYRIVGLAGGKEVTFLYPSDPLYTVAGMYLLTPTLKELKVPSVSEQDGGIIDYTSSSTTVNLNDIVITFNKVKGADTYILWEKAPLSATKLASVWTPSGETVDFVDLDPSETGLACLIIRAPAHPYGDKQLFQYAVQAGDSLSGCTSYDISLLKRLDSFDGE